MPHETPNLMLRRTNIRAAANNLNTAIIRGVPDHAKRAAALAAVEQGAEIAMAAVGPLSRSRAG